MKRLFDYLKPFNRRFYLATAASIMNKVLDLMPPVLVAWVIDTVNGAPPGWIAAVSGAQSAWAQAILLAVVAVVIFGLESGFQWAYQYGFMNLAQDVQHEIRRDGYDAMQHREMAFFENHRLGDTLSVLNDDINQLERFLNTGFSQIVQLGIVFVFCAVVLFYTAWQLAVFALIPIPFILVGSLIYQKKISPLYAVVRQRVGELASRIENNIAGMHVIKSFTAEVFELQRITASSDAYRNANKRAIGFNSVYVPLIRMIIALGFAGVLLVGSYWILNGSDIITIGQLVLFSMLIQRMLWPLTTVGTILDDYERANASCSRIFNLLDTPRAIDDIANPVALPGIKGAISFQSVEFRYEHGPPVLNGLSFDIAPKETIGIAGTTGSGKSTLIKLLLRFYDPKKGQINLDGVEIHQLKQSDLRHAIALVSQDIYLFYGSIYENIAYGLDGVTLDDVKHASRLAHLDAFITTLPNGYDTLVGEKGLKLSGGQRQRLSIARAILKDAPIMVFDEATSSVDTETEKAIKQNIYTITEGKTALIIAHRLSTITHADRILVISNGRLAQEGQHEALIKTPGLYADLWATQTG